MKKGVHHTIVIILSAAGLALLQAGFIFLMVGFLPAVMAYMVDTDRQKNLYKCVLACNFAGMLPTLSTLAGSAYPGAALQVTMSDPKVWLIVYGSAFAGWTLIGMCRWVAYVIISASNQARVLLFEQEMKALREEWGNTLGQ